MPAALTHLENDSARVQLRSLLATYFHAQDLPAPNGYHKWTAPTLVAMRSKLGSNPKLLVGDPITLMENLKILKQYTKLLSQACHERDTPNPLAAHIQPLSPAPSTYPRNLQWFETLAGPYRGLDEFGTERITELLRLHAACDKSVPALPRQQAYELARSLPHFDRDLTAYYLDLKPDAREYELHVAHSVMRLHSPTDLDSLRRHLTTWRHQGLVHVLSVAALNMPDLSDWFPGERADQMKSREAGALVHTLEALRRRPQDYSKAIGDFIPTQDPAGSVSQAIAATLDRLAVLMSVKSNSHTEPGHDLVAALDGFPHLESLEPQDMWCRIKPALEQALPPSLLRLDPSCAKKRGKQADGSW